MRGWRGEGQTHSAILVPVPDAEAAVGPWRRRHDPMATGGVPAHITLIVPWLAPEHIDDNEIARLERIAAKAEPFEFTLRSVHWFGSRVLWLAPDPAQPFLDLTGALVTEFHTPPWAGEFDKVIPHLTVALSTDGAELAGVAAALGRGLPISCRATEVRVMLGDGAHWWERAAVPLG
ncbi:MAG: 2'-5' RNA ligase family protein [Actinomycetota bacterium]|nr:2'-5' RNA ligase family protein [Actinomycetota bacterium]